MTLPVIPKLKLVGDTSFYLAAVLKDGYARSYLLGSGSKFLQYELFISSEILHEVQDKLENKFGLERAQVAEAMRLIGGVVTLVYPRQKVNVVRDPSDNMIIECALEAKADIIISLDKDLLALKTYKSIQMVHPRMLRHWFTTT
jgi:uncharacterized protein